MTAKLLTKQHLEFLNLKGGCTGSYESTLVKMPQCWKSHVTAHVWSIGSTETCVISLENVSHASAQHIIRVRSKNIAKKYVCI